MKKVEELKARNNRLINESKHPLLTLPPVIFPKMYLLKTG